MQRPSGELSAATRHPYPAGLRSRLCRGLVCALIALGVGCSHVPVPKVPKVSLPKLPSLGKDENARDLSATPRDLLAAKLANPRQNPDSPGITVGKLIEVADRALACDCANVRFAKAWHKTADGYRLTTHSEVWRPLEFVCHENAGERQCYLREVDRGPQTATLGQRFVSGSEFIQSMYDNGVQCARKTPCQ